MYDHRDVPECLNRRYQALDHLINDISLIISSSNSEFNFPDRPTESEDPGLKLMCGFWNILKEDPHCDLSNAVQHVMRESPSARTTSTRDDCTRHHSYTCFMAQENPRQPGKENKPRIRDDQDASDSENREPTDAENAEQSTNTPQSHTETETAARSSNTPHTETETTARSSDTPKSQTETANAKRYSDTPKSQTETANAKRYSDTPKPSTETANATRLSDTPKSHTEAANATRHNDTPKPHTESANARRYGDTPKSHTETSKAGRYGETPKSHTESAKAGRYNYTPKSKADTAKTGRYIDASKSNADTAKAGRYIDPPKSHTETATGARSSNTPKLHTETATAADVVQSHTELITDKPGVQTAKPTSYKLKQESIDSITGKSTATPLSQSYVTANVNTNPTSIDSCRNTKSSGGKCNMPLSKVLNNLNEAASFDKKCNTRISELMKSEELLQAQIKDLERREVEGSKMLKQADCMWNCMEDAYKQKIAASNQRQKEFTQQLHAVEDSTAKWRKNAKDLESQLNSTNKTLIKTNDAIKQKDSDIKCMKMEITNLKARVAETKANIESTKKSIASKKAASDEKMAHYAKDVTELKKTIDKYKNLKKNKENEGNKFIKEARADLQSLCKLVLQKKLENEDMEAQKDAIISELHLLEAALNGCKDRCQRKQTTTQEEIKKIDAEIESYKVQCTQCHVCIDTTDMRKLCIDCPRCIAERECLVEGEECNIDHSLDCICQSVKSTFLGNVFENMYTILERQIQTEPGKAVAETVLESLKQSRNGKLNQKTKDILQDFILTTIKNNLNLTIIGGAVKTRCELDPETYDKLMLCLTNVQDPALETDDKGTGVRRSPCERWGKECNCPRDPKDPTEPCMCKLAPPSAKDFRKPCPPNDDDMGQRAACPHKEGLKCGADCGRHATPKTFDPDMRQWRPDPCQGPSCAFKKDTRAAHIMLGSEAGKSQNTPNYIPSSRYYLSENEPSKCCRTSGKPCKCPKCKKEHNYRPRRRKMIEEVMGPYIEVPLEQSFDKVRQSETTTSNKRNKNNLWRINNLNDERYISNDLKKALATVRSPTENCRVLQINSMESYINSMESAMMRLYSLENVEQASVSLESNNSTNQEMQLSVYRNKKYVKETTLAPVFVHKVNEESTRKNKQKRSNCEADPKIVKSVNKKHTKKVIDELLKTDMGLKINISNNDISSSDNEQSNSKQQDSDKKSNKTDKTKRKTMLLRNL